LNYFQGIAEGEKNKLRKKTPYAFRSGKISCLKNMNFNSKAIEVSDHSDEMSHKFSYFISQPVSITERRKKVF
jgi:hypothetical protein